MDHCWLEEWFEITARLNGILETRTISIMKALEKIISVYKIFLKHRITRQYHEHSLIKVYMKDT